MFRVLLVVTACMLSAACAQAHYHQTKVGTLSGKVVVEWMEPDLFLFRPDKKRPLIFVRANGDKIEPGRMYTDGGSIPRPIRALKNYSPWGYGPAFVVHDWLFYMQNCQVAGWDRYSLDDAATIMSEIMKTMMESPKFKYGDPLTVYMMYEAVRTPWARSAWDSRRCTPAPSDDADYWNPKIKFVIDFDQP